MSLYKILGFYPDNVDYYEQAFIHRSVSIRQNGRPTNNERLEFLGDAILNAIVAVIVYKHFPGKKEGFLTNTRSKIVQRESLNQIALDIGLDEKVASLPYVTQHHRYMYGNALEALIGAIYLDKGYAYCYDFIEERIIKRFVSLEQVAKHEVNFKSRLLEWGQKNRLQIGFELVESHTDEHGLPFFQTKVSIEGIPFDTGVGNTKKESHQVASEKLLKRINKDDGVRKLVEELKAKKENEAG